MPMGIGLYGDNGHQIQTVLKEYHGASLVALAQASAGGLCMDGVRTYGTLAEMLADDRVELVSLCSPRRRDQAQDAIACLRAGRHVYAEKPAALSEAELDAVLAVSGATGRSFHEMAGTAFDQPYSAMRDVVRAGRIGRVTQVLVQKSYPYFDARPDDEDVDGGLIPQAGIHAIRMIEHVAGVRVASVAGAAQTPLGKPRAGALIMAASLALHLEGGGVASVVLNYLNPKGFGRWGNEHLRIFGTDGFLESVDGGVRTRLVVGEADLGAIDLDHSARDYFPMVVESLQGNVPLPLTLEEELHPLRIVIRARRAATAQ